MRYKTLEELIDLIESPLKTHIFNIYQSNKQSFLLHAGSQHNHQAWEGGYIDHIIETMNIARLLYQVMTDKRKLDFKLSDALVVLFLHDIEKSAPARVLTQMSSGYARPKAKDTIRYQLLHEIGIWEHLTPEHKSAIDHVEGEKDSYVNEKRVMSPLAAFCHMCDIASARIWYDRPSGDFEVWGSRQVGYPEQEQPMWGV